MLLLFAVQGFFAVTVNAVDLTVAWDPPPAEEGVFAYKLTVYSSTKESPDVYLTVLNNFQLQGLGDSDLLMFVKSLKTNGLESVASDLLRFPTAGSCFVAGSSRADDLPGYRTSGSVLFAEPQECGIQVSSDADWLTVTGVWAIGGQFLITYDAESNRENRFREAGLHVNSKRISVSQAPGGARPVVVSRGLPPSATLSEGENLQLEIQTEAEAFVTYQWFKDGNPITGATNSTYSRLNTGAADAGNYSVAVGNDVGVIFNGPIRVSVLLKPQFIVADSPTIIVAPIGSYATISAPIEGEQLSYTWFRNGVALTNSSASIIFDPITEEDLGDYAVSAQNEAGSVTGRVGLLTTPQQEQEKGRIALDAGLDSRLRISALGMPGQSYRIETSSDLIHWHTIDSVVVDEGGAFLIDSPTPGEDGAAHCWFVRTVRQ